MIRQAHIRYLMPSLVILCSTIVFGQVDQDLLKEIKKIIRHETNISHDDVPGYSIGVIDENNTFIFHFGSSHRDTIISLTDSSIFEIGGLSKVFTALLFNMLAKQGVLDRQESFNTFLAPEDRNNSLDHLTLHDLLTHTSGLGKLPRDLGARQDEAISRYHYYTKSDLLQYYSSLNEPTGKHGKYLYSHINYALLEIAIERRTGEQFAELLSRRIFDPLQMRETGLSVEEFHTSLTPGYKHSGDIAPIWQFASFSASEGLKSSMRDLCKFMHSTFFEAGEIKMAFEQSLQTYHNVPRSKKTRVGDAWHAFINKKYPNIYVHTGKTDGYGASVNFIFENKTAVILLTNAVAPMDGLAMLILRLINDNWKRTHG